MVRAVGAMDDVEFDIIKVLLFDKVSLNLMASVIHCLMMGWLN